jgi:hypothetical protein
MKVRVSFKRAGGKMSAGKRSMATLAAGQPDMEAAL